MIPREDRLGLAVGIIGVLWAIVFGVLRLPIFQALR